MRSFKNFSQLRHVIKTLLIILQVILRCVHIETKYIELSVIRWTEVKIEALKMVFLFLSSIKVNSFNPHK